MNSNLGNQHTKAPPAAALSPFVSLLYPPKPWCEGVMRPLDCASLVNINRRLRDNGRQVSICSIFTVHAGQNRVTWSKCEAQNVRGATYSSHIHQINNMLKKKNRAVNSLTCTWKQSPVNFCISPHCDWLKNLATCFQTITSKTETSD